MGKSASSLPGRAASVQSIASHASGNPLLAMPVGVLINHVLGKHALAWLLLASPLSLSCALPFSGTPVLLMEGKYFKISEELKKVMLE